MCIRDRSCIVFLGGQAGKQLYEFHDHWIVGAGGGDPRLFCLPFLPVVFHAGTLSYALAPIPRGILAALLQGKPTRRYRRAGEPQGSATRRPGAHQPIGENAPDVLQIDQRIAALERARRAATQIVPGLAEQGSQLAIAEGLKC